MGSDENLGELSMSVLCLLSETSQSQASSQFCQNCPEPSHGQLHGLWFNIPAWDFVG